MDEKELLELRELMELQEIRNIIIEKVITPEEFNLRMTKRIERTDLMPAAKEYLLERYQK